MIYKWWRKKTCQTLFTEFRGYVYMVPVCGPVPPGDQDQEWDHDHDRWVGLEACTIYTYTYLFSRCVYIYYNIYIYILYIYIYIYVQASSLIFSWGDPNSLSEIHPRFHCIKEHKARRWHFTSWAGRAPEAGNLKDPFWGQGCWGSFFVIPSPTIGIPQGCFYQKVLRNNLMILIFDIIWLRLGLFKQEVELVSHPVRPIQYCF